jgi:uncharacterized membrane protein YdjX (TVP38/TMEM64 family)
MDTISGSGPGPGRRAGLRAGVGIALVLAALLLLRYAVREQLTPRAALEILQAVRERGWAIPAFLLLYVGLTAAFAPAALFHMVAGVAWGFWPGVALNLVACNGAANVQFAAARRLGRERVRWVLQRSGVAGLEARLLRSGLRAMILVRLLPLPTMAVNLGAGVSAVRWRDFALGTAVGTLPIIGIYTWFAAELVKGAEGAERRVLFNLAIAGACLVALVLGPRLWLRLRSGGKGRGAP